jgi:hypothetical protein
VKEGDIISRFPRAFTKIKSNSGCLLGKHFDRAYLSQKGITIKLRDSVAHIGSSLESLGLS